MMPSALRSSGSRLMPARIAAARGAAAHAAPADHGTLPGVQRQRAGDGLGGLGAAGAEQPAEADHLAGPHVQTDTPCSR